MWGHETSDIYDEAVFLYNYFITFCIKPLTHSCSLTWICLAIDSNLMYTCGESSRAFCTHTSATMARSLGTLLLDSPRIIWLLLWGIVMDGWV